MRSAGNLKAASRQSSIGGILLHTAVLLPARRHIPGHRMELLQKEPWQISADASKYFDRHPSRMIAESIA